MLQSRLFTKTRKDAPKDEVSKNASLLIRAGFVHKEMAGVYSYLPLGLIVLKKIEQIIREEMNALGGQEINMTALQEAESFEKTGRWDDKVVDNWFKTRLKNDTELGLAYTHEPSITRLMKDHISSYRDLPVYPYQFQTKFRNELRAKSGLFRSREFVMKDLYSFSATEKQLDDFYEEAVVAYKKIFNRLSIGDRTYLTLASGGSFGTKYSHEFQTLTSAGEDTIYVNKKKDIAINKEILNDDTLENLGIKKEELTEEKSIEVGNVYKLGTFYSKPLGLSYRTETGEDRSVVMGSYGIGLGRVMGTIVEVFADDRGIVWPESIAPFRFHLVEVLGSGGDASLIKNSAKNLYEELGGPSGNVLYDDRDIRVGEKFGDSDLIGIPWRVVVSARTVESDLYEVKNRKTSIVKMLSLKELLALL